MICTNHLKVFDKKNHFFLFYTPLILVFFTFLFQATNSQEIFQNSIDTKQFNTVLDEYNTTKIYFNDLQKKMEKITMNIVLRIRFKNINRLYDKIEKKLLYIKGELKKDKYDNIQIKKDIDLLNQNMNLFKKKYNEFNNAYYDFDIIKKTILSFIKLFFIIIIIIIIVALILIGVGTFFVIKSQKKYYRLKEEYSITNEPKIESNDEKINVNKNHHNIKNHNNRLKPEKTKESLKSENNNIKIEVVQSTNNNTSKEDFKNNKKV